VLDGSEPKGDHYYWRTEFVSDLDDELLATVRELAAECPIPRAQIGLLHLGGALNDRAADDGAVGNRDARYACGVIGAWGSDEADEDAFRDWVRAAGERCRRFSTGNYINFQSADEGEHRIRESYGANFARLAALKARYDPDNCFRSNRNIAAAAGEGPEASK
jgi:hypothetical protein